MSAVVFEGFDDITKDDILKAIEEYDELEKKGELNKNRSSRDYLLIYNGKEYPPVYIVDIAYGLRNNALTLDSKSYYSRGNHQKSAQWCLEKNGFALYEDKKYKNYLEKKFNKGSTVQSYYSGLKHKLKVCQKLESLKDKSIIKIIEMMKNKEIDEEEYREIHK